MKEFPGSRGESCNAVGWGRATVWGVALLAVSLSAHPQSSETPAVVAPDEAPIEVKTFRGPSISKQGGLRYPPDEARDGGEGWVILNMMIDPQGKPFEAAVVQSIGGPSFEKEALRAIEKFQFEPASDGGQSIDSSFTIKMLFHMREPARGASEKFVAAYRKTMKAVEAGNRIEADAQRAKLEVKNLYEDAYRNIAAYYYHLKWGTEAEQLGDLRQAIAGEKVDRYLPRDTFRQALTAIFGMETRAQDFGSALQTWKALKPVAAKQDLANLQKVVDRINELRANDSAVSLSGQIVRGTAWNGTLFKRRFHVAVAEGNVAEIKLKCEKRYLFLRYQPDVEYTVQSSAGECNIEVVGEPGTRFQLNQS